MIITYCQVFSAVVHLFLWGQQYLEIRTDICEIMLASEYLRGNEIKMNLAK